MEYRRLGGSGPEVSALGVGTWEIGNPGYGATDEGEAVAAIQRALDLGVTCFDTAPAYGFGRAEEVLGRALGRRRREVTLVTKGGLSWQGEGESATWWRDSSPERITTEVDGSLRRLGTDWIDLYLVHWPDDRTPIAATAAAMGGLLRSGKVRAVGVSNFGVGQIEEFARVCPISAVQVGYNLFDRRVEAAVLPACRERGWGVMAYGALCYGLLTGAFSAETRFDPPDWRATGRAFGLELFTPEHFPRNVAVVDRLKPLAAALGKTVPQVALNWLLQRPGVTVSLTGVRRPREIEENAGAVGWRLPAEAAALIEEVFGAAAGATGPLPEW